MKTLISWPWLAVSISLHAALLAASAFRRDSAEMLAPSAHYEPVSLAPAQPAAPAAAPVPPPTGLPSEKRARIPTPTALPEASAPAPATYLQDARDRIESRFPARFPPPIREALARAQGPLRATLLLGVDARGALTQASVQHSSGAPDVDDFLLRVARGTETFLPPPGLRPFTFQVPLEIYASR